MRPAELEFWTRCADTGVLVCPMFVYRAWDSEERIGLFYSAMAGQGPFVAEPPDYYFSINSAVAGRSRFWYTPGKALYSSSHGAVPPALDLHTPGFWSACAEEGVAICPVRVDNQLRYCALQTNGTMNVSDPKYYAFVGGNVYGRSSYFDTPEEALERCLSWRAP